MLERSKADFQFDFGGLLKMKKKICMLLVLCCFVSSFSFSAYAKYDGEITFRDIPWGSTYEEVMEALKDLDVKWSTLYDYHYRSLDGIMIDCDDTDSNFVSIYYVKGTPNYKTLKVGGFEVENIYLYFARTTENGNVMDDKAHTYFYIGEYDLKKTDPNSEDNDLRLLNKKLSGIYGNYDIRDSRWAYSATMYFYYGNNSTEVVPVNEYHAILGSLNALRLYYVCTKGDDIARKTDKILFDIAAQTDTDGL